MLDEQIQTGYDRKHKYRQINSNTLRSVLPSSHLYLVQLQLNESVYPLTNSPSSLFLPPHSTLIFLKSSLTNISQKIKKIGSSSSRHKQHFCKSSRLEGILSLFLPSFFVTMVCSSTQIPSSISLLLTLQKLFPFTHFVEACFVIHFVTHLYIVNHFRFGFSFMKLVFFFSTEYQNMFPALYFFTNHRLYSKWTSSCYGIHRKQGNSNKTIMKVG